MKIPVIQYSCSRQYYRNQDLGNKPKGNSNFTYQENLPPVYTSPQISFGLENSKNIKKLFEYGLPSIYSGVEMIDSKLIHKWMNAKLFDLPAYEIIKRLQHYEKSITNRLETDENIDTAKQAYLLIKDYAQYDHKSTLKEIIQILVPDFKKQLFEEQKPIFKELKKQSRLLPEEYQQPFRDFINQTCNQVNERPVHIPFSTKEFKYKLSKIKEDLNKFKNFKTTSHINDVIKLSNLLEDKTDTKNIIKQQKILAEIDSIVRSCSLNGNEPLRNLIDISISRLNSEDISIPFKRKAFIYDLYVLLADIPDNKLRGNMIKIADKLPASSNSLAAWMVKYSRETNEKIFYDLLWPSMATVEHLLPRSEGGANAMSNYAGATAKENSDRASLVFTEQIKKFPDVAGACQKYINRLIYHYKLGVFDKEKINPKYIEDFKRTIETLSKGAITLNTSSLYKGNKKAT